MADTTKTDAGAADLPPATTSSAGAGSGPSPASDPGKPVLLIKEGEGRFQAAPPNYEGVYLFEPGVIFEVLPADARLLLAGQYLGAEGKPMAIQAQGHTWREPTSAEVADLPKYTPPAS